MLRACRRGGPAAGRAQLETSRVFACAPLIFFFYRYGIHASVRESTEVARELYWYALAHNRRPYDAGLVLTHLLRTWGVR